MSSGAANAANRGSALLFGAVLLAYGGSQCIFNVDGGHRAVIFSRLSGMQPHVYFEGTHFLIPWLHKPMIFDCRSRPRVNKSPTGSKDLQFVTVSTRVLCRPIDSELPVMASELGLDWEERIMPSIVNEVLKSVVAQFNASQLNAQREMVSKLVRQQLTERALEFHIRLDDVSITDLGFSPVYMRAVEAKQVAQQEAQRAQFTVETAKQEASRAIVRAEGEAKAAELIGRQVRQNPGFVQLRRIEAAVKVAQIVAESGNKLVLNTNALMLNVQDQNNIDERKQV